MGHWLHTKVVHYFLCENYQALLLRKWALTVMPKTTEATKAVLNLTDTRVAFAEPNGPYDKRISVHHSNERISKCVNLQRTNA